MIGSATAQHGTLERLRPPSLHAQPQLWLRPPPSLADKAAISDP